MCCELCSGKILICIRVYRSGRLIKEFSLWGDAWRWCEDKWLKEQGSNSSYRLDWPLFSLCYVHVCKNCKHEKRFKERFYLPG